MSERTARAAKRHFYVAFLVAVAAGMLGMVTSSRVHAEPNTLDLFVSGVELRNEQVVILTIANEEVQESKIEIRHMNGDAFETPVVEKGEAKQKTIVLEWDSRSVPDDSYKITYSAKIADVWMEEESKEIAVVNDWPLVTLNQEAEARTISGFVSRSDVTFRIVVGGKEVPTPVVTVANVAETNGMHAWRYTLLDSAGDGEQLVEVFATKQGGGRESAVASRTFSLPLTVATPPPVTPVVPQILPIIDFAQEIGQFIAPVIPETPQLKLFGVPVTDITAAPPQQTTVPSVLGVAAANRYTPSAKMAHTDIQPATLQASDKGWQIFGIAWYWWAAGVAGVCGVGVIVRRVFKSQRTVTGISST